MTDSSTGEEPVESEVGTDSMDQGRLLRAASWTTIGRGVSMVLALGSSLILTRLLTLEVYGIYELVWVVMTALHMFSDVGLTPNVVQSPHGDDPRFLNVVWTVQIIRGVILFAGSILLAFPAASLLEQPDLVLLVPAVGFGGFITGFISVGIHTSQRNLDLFPLMRLNILRQATTIIVQILIAMVWPTAWAFVIGFWCGGVVEVIGSFKLFSTIRHRILWDKIFVREIVGFGQWIFLATALNFVAVQSDRLIISKLVGSMAMLGLYAIAHRLSAMITTLSAELIHKVLMPSVAEKRRALGPDDDEIAVVTQTYYRTKLRFDAVLITITGCFCALATDVVDILYTDAYEQAGPYLRILLVGGLFHIIEAQPGTLLTALGHSQHHMWQALLRAVYTLIALPIGFYVGGFEGIVVAVACTKLVGAPVYWYQLHVLGILRPAREFVGAAFFPLGFMVGYMIHLALGF